MANRMAAAETAKATALIATSALRCLDPSARRSISMGKGKSGPADLSHASNGSNVCALPSLPSLRANNPEPAMRRYASGGPAATRHGLLCPLLVGRGAGLTFARAESSMTPRLDPGLALDALVFS